MRGTPAVRHHGGVDDDSLPAPPSSPVSSSPDPLALSTLSPAITSHRIGCRAKTPLGIRSANASNVDGSSNRRTPQKKDRSGRDRAIVHTADRDGHSSYAKTSSPSKSVTLNTPTIAGPHGTSSPWKIRVTVEAEPNTCPGSWNENINEFGERENPANFPGSPTPVRRRGRPSSASPMKKRSQGRLSTKNDTRTTTVPLKDAEDSAPVRRRGRPRKSDVGAGATPPAKNRKRAATPARRKSRGREAEKYVEVDAADDVFGGEVQAADHKARGTKTTGILAVVADDVADDGDVEAARGEGVEEESLHASNAMFSDHISGAENIAHRPSVGQESGKKRGRGRPRKETKEPMGQMTPQRRETADLKNIAAHCKDRGEGEEKVISERAPGSVDCSKSAYPASESQENQDVGESKGVLKRRSGESYQGFHGASPSPASVCTEPQNAQKRQYAPSNNCSTDLVGESSVLSDSDASSVGGARYPAVGGKYPRLRLPELQSRPGTQREILQRRPTPVKPREWGQEEIDLVLSSDSLDPMEKESDHDDQHEQEHMDQSDPSLVARDASTQEERAQNGENALGNNSRCLDGEVGSRGPAFAPQGVSEEYKVAGNSDAELGHDDSEVYQQHQDADDEEKDDSPDHGNGLSETVGDQTILESEGFSMVSVDSLTGELGGASASAEDVMSGIEYGTRHSELGRIREPCSKQRQANPSPSSLPRSTGLSGPSNSHTASSENPHSISELSLHESPDAQATSNRHPSTNLDTLSATDAFSTISRSSIHSASSASQPQCSGQHTHVPPNRQSVVLDHSFGGQPSFHSVHQASYSVFDSVDLGQKGTPPITEQSSISRRPSPKAPFSSLHPPPSAYGHGRHSMSSRARAATSPEFSYMPSSPPVAFPAIMQRTPVQPAPAFHVSSLSTPSAPHLRSVDKALLTPPPIESAVRAGIALQGLLDAGNDAPQNSSGLSIKDRSRLSSPMKESQRASVSPAQAYGGHSAVGTSVIACSEPHNPDKESSLEPNQRSALNGPRQRYERLCGSTRKSHVSQLSSNIVAAPIVQIEPVHYPSLPSTPNDSPQLITPSPTSDEDNAQKEDKSACDWQYMFRARLRSRTFSEEPNPIDQLLWEETGSELPYEGDSQGSLTATIGEKQACSAENQPDSQQKSRHRDSNSRWAPISGELRNNDKAMPTPSPRLCIETTKGDPDNARRIIDSANPSLRRRSTVNEESRACAQIQAHHESPLQSQHSTRHNTGNDSRRVSPGPARQTQSSCHGTTTHRPDASASSQNR
ncbi:hypothetical protein BDY21DRAFT_420727, partial [Lineolata rhizophorae]